MAREEQAEVGPNGRAAATDGTAAENAAAADPAGFVQQHAPWLLAPELGTCVVGSTALRLRCDRDGVAGPRSADLDLAWALDPTAGRALLQQHDAFLPTTEGNLGRGTVAASVGGVRLEITTFRGGEGTDAPPAERHESNLAERIRADLAERDMTIGGIAVELATGTIHDPHDGFQHWQNGRIAPIGDPAERVREHPVRWLRYFRKAHELGFSVDPKVRALALDPALLLELPPEAVAGELRAILLKCNSPGRCLLELHEANLLDTIAPELARQFDGRPAGPQRWHPEVSQALHLILALEWIVEHSRHLDERDRLTVLLAVLTHDLGKGYTEAARLPSHHGHEHDGIPYVERLLDRWPGLADARARNLARHVCAQHLTVRNFDGIRPGTLAKLYDDWFRQKDYPIELFALAVAADSAGRLGLENTGDDVKTAVQSRLEWLRAACTSVDAAAIRAQHPDDVSAFKNALHEARARAIRSAEPRP